MVFFPAGHGGSGIASAGVQTLRVAARAFDVILLTGLDALQAVIAPVPRPLAVCTALPGKRNLDTELYEWACPLFVNVPVKIPLILAVRCLQSQLGARRQPARHKTAATVLSCLYSEPSPP